MAFAKKLAFWIVGIALLVGVYVVQDWYRFAKYGEIDAKRGIFGNDHLEVWIDINARMPGPMRKWACKTLLDREAAVLGGRGMVYGCQSDFDPNATGPAMSVSLTESMVNNAVGIAGSKANETQKAAIAECVKAAIAEKITPEQIAAIDGSTYDAAAADALTKVGLEAGQTCLAAQGFN